MQPINQDSTPRTLSLDSVRFFLCTTPLELYWDESTYAVLGEVEADGFLLKVYMRRSDLSVFVFPSRIKTSGYRSRYLEFESAVISVQLFLHRKFSAERELNELFKNDSE